MSAVLLGGCDGRVAPGATDGGLIALGGGTGGPANACFTCHGLDGRGDGAATPRLAGLEAGHLNKQLQDYASGLRDDAVMRPISRQLSPRERQAISHFYANLESERSPAASEADVALLKLGADLYALGAPSRGLQPCAACHGAPHIGGGLAIPALAAQPAAYTETQLLRWRSGERRNDPRGVMADQAKRLTGREIVALAAYLASVPRGGSSSQAVE